MGRDYQKMCRMPYDSPYPSGAKQPKSILRMPYPSGAKPTRTSKDSVQFKGNWEETRDSLHKKVGAANKNTLFDESSSDEEVYQPRKSMAPQRVHTTQHINGQCLDIITSNISFQEKMHEREEKEKRNKSVFANAIRKTKVWVQEAVTGEPVFSDEDWEENLARETALEKVKKKKDKEFARDMIRKSTALGLDRHETHDMIMMNEQKPLRLTAVEAAMVEAETQRLVKISREERDEEEEYRRESRAVEKANKMPNRFSLALKTVIFGSSAAAEDIVRHPRFNSQTSMHEVDAHGQGVHRETSQRRPTKFNFVKKRDSSEEEETESEESEEDEEEESELNDASDSIDLEDEEFYNAHVTPLDKTEEKYENPQKRDVYQENHRVEFQPYEENIEELQNKIEKFENYDAQKKLENYESEHKYQQQSSETDEETIIYEHPPDTIKIEHEIEENTIPKLKGLRKPEPPKEPSPRDHTPRPQDKFINKEPTKNKHRKNSKDSQNSNSQKSPKIRSPIISHTKIKKHRRNRKNVSVEDLSLQCDLGDVEPLNDSDLYSIVEVNEIGCQFPSLQCFAPNHAVSDDECASLRTDCSESIQVPAYRPFLKKNQSQESFSPRKQPIRVELMPWAEEVWSRVIESNDLSSPQAFLDKQSNRHDISTAIHQNVKLFQEPSTIQIPKYTEIIPDSNTTLQIFDTYSPTHSNINFNKQAENMPLPDTPVFTKNINKEARKDSLISLASFNLNDRKDSIMTMDLINAPILLDCEMSVLDDIESLNFDEDVKEVKKRDQWEIYGTSQETIPENTVNEEFIQNAWASNVQVLNGQNGQSQNIQDPSVQFEEKNQVEPHGPSNISLYR